MSGPCELSDRQRRSPCPKCTDCSSVHSDPACRWAAGEPVRQELQVPLHHAHHLHRVRLHRLAELLRRVLRLVPERLRLALQQHLRLRLAPEPLVTLRWQGRTEPPQQ